MLKAPHTKREIDTQKQQKTHQTHIQQDVKKTVVGNIDLERPMMTNLHQDPEAFLHPQRAISIPKNWFLQIKILKKVLPHRNSPCHISRPTKQAKKESGVCDKNKKTSRQNHGG